MTENKIVYIASPYTGDVKQNTAFAIAACRYAIARGYTPLAPHLLYTRMLNDSEPAQREMGLKLGRRLLETADELWICGDRVSSGMAAEIAEANRLGVPTKQVTALEVFTGGELLNSMTLAETHSDGMEMRMR